MPMTNPGRVEASVAALVSADAAVSEGLATPKSRTLTWPLSVIMMLVGLRSRWMMPASCAAANASAI